MSGNRFGLDVRYFTELIARTLRDIDNYKPDEFARVCARMSVTADANVILENEFLGRSTLDTDRLDWFAFAAECGHPHLPVYHNGIGWVVTFARVAEPDIRCQVEFTTLREAIDRAIYISDNKTLFTSARK